MPIKLVLENRVLHIIYLFLNHGSKKIYNINKNFRNNSIAVLTNLPQGKQSFGRNTKHM